MAKPKRFYWIKLKENFFNDDSMIWLESQKDGFKYQNLYLKLLCLSNKTYGKLIYVINGKFKQMDIEDIARITRFDVDFVNQAINLFVKLGLVELVSGIYTLPLIHELVGSEMYISRSVCNFHKDKKSNCMLGQILSYDTKEISNSYKEYLLTEHWKLLRKNVMNIRNNRCEICGACIDDKTANIHHKTYLRVGYEDYSDLILCCNECHITIHKTKNRARNFA